MFKYKILKNLEFKLGKLYTLFIRNSFKEFGEKSFFFYKSRIDYPQNMEVGYNVTILPNCWINALGDYNKDCRIVFDDKSALSFDVQISAAKYIYIGKNVGVSRGCVIVDHIHSYSDVEKSIFYQDISEPKDVIIEDNSFLAVNCVVAPGVHIGKHVFVGANSVVVHNIPSYSIAAGNPAKVIKKYNFDKKIWEKVKEE